MNLKMVGAACLAAAMVLPVNAADDAAAKKRKGGKGAQRNAANQLLKQLESVELTDEQVAKIKEFGKEAAAKMKQIRDEAGISPAITKKRAEAQKSMKDSGKKGKELVAAINKEAGLSEAQAAAFQQAAQVRQKFQSDVVALLSDEQKEKLPARMKRGGGAARKAKAKKKN